MLFFVKSYAISHTKFHWTEIVLVHQHFLVATLYFYLNGERNIKLFQAVYVSVSTIFAISTCDWRTLPRTENLYFLAATLHFTWMVKEYKAVSSSVRVSQQLFLCETTLFLCETNTVSMWNNSVSMWNKPCFYGKQLCFYVKQTPLLCETTLSPCGRTCIFGDSSLFFFDITESFLRGRLCFRE